MFVSLSYEEWADFSLAAFHCGHVRHCFINVHNHTFVILIVPESIPCLCVTHADL